MRFTQLLWCVLLLLRFGFLAEAILNPVDFLALQAIRKSLHDLPGSNYFRSWDFTSDPCSFAGVYCDGDKVVSLNLGDPRAGSPGLSGRINPAIGKLSALTELSIVPGRIMGALPATISQLKDLRFLAISRNFISGEIPASLGEVRRLRTLDLSYNQLTGTISPAIGSLPELSNLILCHNHLTGSIPPFLSHTLTRIDLKRNSLTGSLSPASFPPSLQYLSLAWNQLTGPVDRVLLRLNQINYLDLSLNRLTGTIPGRIFAFPITSLQLQRNFFYGYIQPASQVTIPTVDLSYNRFSGWISPLLSSVQNLYLNSNRFTGEVPTSFVERLLSASIHTLYLQHNFLTGIQISPAAEIPASSSLCLQYNCMVLPLQTPCPLKAGSQKARPITQCNQWRG
ncbi:Leucine-rich repeat (LRR) family protein [Raphanus sativus]|uniref:LRR receptor-like serine/threonine-protein kinase ERL1 n=1 Tax=Raphanus sativus TaxID=3726 RepID=A0A6J0M2P7_RAPSA|nr:LRR receptor-like serine/threonine-protein kinase ERL1 [Raphanus sativus]KAJ4878786.1 Leucine-rich repeat (LRR) family protein [Raphanus sativus]